MAANMIGVKKAVIVVAAGPFQFAMVNGHTKKTGGYETEEGCLSLDGVRHVRVIKRSRWSIWMRILNHSTGNTVDLPHRSYSMKWIIQTVL